MQRRYRRNPGGSSGGMGSLMPLALIGGAIWLLSRPGGIGGLFQSSGTGVPSTVDAFTRSQGRAPFSQAEADSWAQGPEYQGMLRAAGVTRGTSSPTNPSDLGTAFQLSLVKAGVPAATGLVSAAISNWFKLLGSGQNAAGVPTAVGNPESASTALAAYRAGEHADPWAAPLPSDPFYQDPWAAPLSVPDLQAAGMMDYAAPVDYSAPFDLSAGSAMTIADAEMALSGFTI